MHSNGTSANQPESALGTYPVGILMYHPSGYMSATMASTNTTVRPQNISYPFSKTDSLADWALVGQHTLSYAGPYSFTGRNEGEMRGEVKHGPLFVANVPNWVGSDQLRNFTLVREGDGWVLAISIWSEARKTDGRIYWRQATV
jgi:hypothetical protein